VVFYLNPDLVSDTGIGLTSFLSSLGRHNSTCVNSVQIFCSISYLKGHTRNILISSWSHNCCGTFELQ